jgi:hypothetical protein
MPINTAKQIADKQQIRPGSSVNCLNGITKTSSASLHVKSDDIDTTNTNVMTVTK